MQNHKLVAAVIVTGCAVSGCEELEITIIKDVATSVLCNTIDEVRRLFMMLLELAASGSGGFGCCYYYALF